MSGAEGLAALACAFAGVAGACLAQEAQRRRQAAGRRRAALGRAGADDEKISLFHGLRILQSEKNMHTKRKNFLYSTRFDRLLGQGLVQCACSLSNTSSFHIQVRPIRANPTTFALHSPVEGAFFVRHLSAAVGGTSPLGEALGCEGSP